jgi:hypothetical protein
MNDRNPSNVDESGRKNGFYKNISALEVSNSDSSSNNPHIYITGLKVDPSSMSSSTIKYISSDTSKFTALPIPSPVQELAPKRVEEFKEEIKYLKQSLYMLQNQITLTTEDVQTRADKIKDLEKVTTKNKKKIKAIKQEIKNHQEKIIKIEGKLMEQPSHEDVSFHEKNSLKPYLSDRKIVPKLRIKPGKKKQISSLASSPRVKHQLASFRINSPKIKK